MKQTDEVLLIIETYKKKYNVDLSKGILYEVINTNNLITVKFTPKDNISFNKELTSFIDIVFDKYKNLFNEYVETSFYYYGGNLDIRTVIDESSLFEEKVKSDEDLDLNIEEPKENLNDSIKRITGLKNVSINPDLSLNIEDNLSDNSFTIIDSFEKYLKNNIYELDLAIKIADKSSYEYYKNSAILDFYTDIINKYFDREYSKAPKLRLESIKARIEQEIIKFEPWLKSINYIQTETDDIEAIEKTINAKFLLSEFFSNKINSSNIDTYNNDIKTDDLSDFFNKVENDFFKEDDIKIKNLSEYDKMNLKEKIEFKWKEVLQKSIEIDKEENGIIQTYVQTMYNPEFTTLDDKNLLLNLNIVSRMQNLKNMEWVFDSERVKVSNTEIDLNHKWWHTILSENIEDDLKYTKIVEKDLNLAFYTSLISSLLKNSDKTLFSNRNLKFGKLFSDKKEFTKESLLFDMLLKKTEDDSILFITPDMEKHIELTHKVKEELGDKGQLKYLGIWNNRYLFSINVDMINGLQNYKNEIIYINKGNSYLLSPDKPIAYYNFIQNPFLDKGLLKWYACADFDILMNRTGRIQIDEEFMN